MNRNKVLETILVLVIALGVLYWVTKNGYFLAAAAATGFIGLFIPPLAAAIHRAWMKLAMAMGFVMSRVVLTVLFFLFLVPLAFISRLFRKRSMRLKPGGDSYFKTRNFEYNRESFENVW